MESAYSSPSAALVTVCPFTTLSTSCHTVWSAGPRAPRSGSLMSITSAPPARAISASAALRTLTRRPVISELSMGELVAGLRGRGGLFFYFGQSLVHFAEEAGGDGLAPCTAECDVAFAPVADGGPHVAMLPF